MSLLDDLIVLENGKRYTINGYIVKLQQENKQLKEVIEEVRGELKHIDKDIMETCKTYDVNGIKIKQILDKVKDETITSFQCFHCLTDNVSWDCDYNFEDLDYEGQGTVHILHCTNCGAEIEYKVHADTED